LAHGHTRMSEQMADFGKPVFEGDFKTCSDLLCWYLDRAMKDKSLSVKRKVSMKSAFTKHLIPILEDVQISDVTNTLLDELFFVPLQEEFALSTVRNWFAMLKVSFKRAAKLKKIAFDPTTDIQFSDFTKAKILPRPAALKASNIPSLLSDFDSQNKPLAGFCWLLLVFGTRIGETRMAMWANIDFRRQEWIIPAQNTKTKQQLTLPLDSYLCQMLKDLYNWQVSHGWNMKYVFGQNHHPLDPTTANKWIQSVSRHAWTAHHLRKLARDCWMDIGIDYMTCEFLLNHKKDKLDATYIHTHAEALKREAITKWVQYLLGERPRQNQDCAA